MSAYHPPLSLLKDDTIVVLVFEGAATLLPVWIEGRDLRESGLQHGLASSLPFGVVGQIEDDQVFRRVAGTDGVGTAVGEFEVVTEPDSAKHDSIESFMVLESSDFGEAEALAVHGNGSLQCGDGAGDA